MSILTESQKVTVYEAIIHLEQAEEHLKEVPGVQANGIVVVIKSLITRCERLAKGENE